MGTDDDIPENELLSIPSDSLSGLPRLSTRRAVLLYQNEMAELAAELAGTARPLMLFPDRAPRAKQQHEEEERRRALLAYEAAMQEVRDHADRLLLRLDEQQHEIERRRTELEGRALQLHDGRRVWIDGDQYRNDSGVILQGSDHQVAETLARQHPDAATWAERTRIDQQAQDIKRLRDRVIAERDHPGSDPEQSQQRLSQYEQELQLNSDQRRDVLKSSPVEYGDPDYMSLTSVPAFNAAAPGALVDEAEEKKTTESASADNKRSLRPQGQGGPKLC
jgi:hypothetical protein